MILKYEVFNELTTHPLPPPIGYLKVYSLEGSLWVMRADGTKYNFLGSNGAVMEETDPIFKASPAGLIADTDIIAWDEAHGWGDHALAGYEPAIAAGTVEQYIRGDKTLATLPAPGGVDTLETVMARGASSPLSPTFGGRVLVSPGTDSPGGYGRSAYDLPVALLSGAAGSPIVGAGMSIRILAGEAIAQFGSNFWHYTGLWNAAKAGAMICIDTRNAAPIPGGHTYPVFQIQTRAPGASSYTVPVQIAPAPEGSFIIGTNGKGNFFYGLLAEGKTVKGIGGWTEDLGFTFMDITPGTVQTYTLYLKAKFAFTINSIILEGDAGTLTGVAVKIGSIPVTGLGAITIDTSVVETTATAANMVAIGDRITITTSVGYTGAPKSINGQINYTRN